VVESLPIPEDFEAYGRSGRDEADALAVDVGPW
jgi:hypothetical protein